MNPTKEEQWRGIIRDCAKRGLSQRDFCEAEEIAYSTFQYWKKRIEGNGESPRFVRVATEWRPCHKISISFGPGIRMIVSEDVSTETLSRIIRAVNGVICGSTGKK